MKLFTLIYLFCGGSSCLLTCHLAMKRKSGECCSAKASISVSLSIPVSWPPSTHLGLLVRFSVEEEWAKDVTYSASVLSV